MKKYKLIKEYPGSPPLNTIAEPSGDVKYTYPNNEEHFESSSSGNLFKKLIENQPEFWEEVVEKDYEILSYIQIISNRVYKKDKDGIFVSDNGWNLSIPLESHSNIKIHSVKRLSDGVIFTVGDKVTERLSNKSNVIIKSFNIHLNKLIIEVSKESLNTTVELAFLNKLKQPLFTTEDGVDIYYRDRFFNVSSFIINEYQVTNEKYPLIFLKDKSLNFSTKEKAEEYVLMNKPCLSIQDVLDMYVFDIDIRLSILNTKENLKELVKERLNANKR